MYWSLIAGMYCVWQLTHDSYRSCSDVEQLPWDSSAYGRNHALARGNHRGRPIVSTHRRPRAGTIISRSPASTATAASRMATRVFLGLLRSLPAPLAVSGRDRSPDVGLRPTTAFIKYLVIVDHRVGRARWRPTPTIRMRRRRTAPKPKAHLRTILGVREILESIWLRRTFSKNMTACPEETMQSGVSSSSWMPGFSAKVGRWRWPRQDPRRRELAAHAACPPTESPGPLRHHHRQDPGTPARPRVSVSSPRARSRPSP